LVRHALAGQRALLIVDSWETVDDERVLTFIREVPDPTKVIVTSRHRLDVAYPVRLVGMEEPDALTLIADEAKKKGVILTDEESRRLYQRTGGVPLAMVWSVAQMGFGYGVEAVLTRLGRPTNDIAEFCFESVVERIKDRPAYKLLLALSLFATDAVREALGYVTNLPELDRDEGLVELEKLSLVNRETGWFGLLPLVRLYSAHKLEQTLKFAQPAFERMLIYYRQLVAPPLETKVGVPYWDGLTNYAQAESLEREWPNLAQVIRQTLDQARHNVALQLFLPIVHFLHIWGLWDERLQLSREMCQQKYGYGLTLSAIYYASANRFLSAFKPSRRAECWPTNSALTKPLYWPMFTKQVYMLK
jgi:LuxR family glucitol operon transcriptional activator